MTVADAGATRRGPARPAAAIGGGRLFLRRLRLEPGPPLTMLVLVGVTCFLFAALPRLANAFADDGLRYMVEHSAPLQRNIRTLETVRLAAGRGDPLANVAARARRSRESLPAALRSLVVDSTFLVRSPRYVLQEDVGSTAFAPGASTPGASAPGLIRYLTVRVQSGVGPHIRLVAGRLPGPSDVRIGTRVEHPIFLGDRTSTVSWRMQVPVLQVALSTANARLLRAHVGDRMIFRPGRIGAAPDALDAAVQRVPLRDAKPLAAEVVGLFVPKDPEGPFWFGDPTLGTPQVQRTPDLETTQVFGQALVSANEYGSMLEATRPIPLAYEYRHFVAAERFDAGRLGAVNDSVGRLEARYADAGPLERRVEIGLGSVLTRYSAAREQAQTLLAVAAIGLFACALACIGLLGALSYDRRRTETGVSRARGASPPQVLAAQAAEGLLVAAPAGLVGWAVAVLAIGDRGSGVSAWLALALVAATVILLVAAIAGVARRPLRPSGRDDVVVARTSPRRLALEGLVAAAAALGVYLLRRRGLESANATGFDPYLAGVPVLLGLACAIVALRLYPLPVAAAAKLARRGRGVAVHLGLSRAARQSDVSSAPLLVLVLALAIVIFSSAMLRTLEAGQNRAGVRAVGAELRVDAAEDESLPPRLLSRLDSLGDVARAYVQDAGVGAVGQATLLIALDVAAYQRVVAKTSASVRVPAELRGPPPIPGLVPALVSTDWPAPGTFQVALAHQSVNVLTIGDRASFPGVPRGVPFAVVPLGALSQAAGEPIPPNRVYLRGVGPAAAKEAVDDSVPHAEIASRGDLGRRLRANPLVENVFRGFRAAIVLAALYAAVAVGLMALIAARSRSRDLALVRTMGASPRDTLVLAAVELAPFVAMALALGIGLGIAIPYVIAPGLDLAFFTGTDSSAIAIPWLAPAASAIGVLVLVGASVLVVGLRARRAGLDRVLRIGER